MIKIYCMFRLRDPWISRKVREYIERIKRYERVEIIENVKNIPEDAILLDERGVSLTSHEFAEKIRKDLSLVVGPPEGFNDREREKHELLSLSRMTIQHELALLLLVEQVYRAITINRGMPYHK